MFLVYEGSTEIEVVLWVEQKIKCARMNVESRVVRGWNKMNQMRRHCSNEETKVKGKPTKKYEDEKSKVKKL